MKQLKRVPKKIYPVWTEHALSEYCTACTCVQGRRKQNRSGQASRQKMLSYKLFMRHSCPLGALFYIYLPLAVTLNAVIFVNTTDPRPIASWQKMSSEHTWHLDVDRFGAADVHKSRPIYCCFNYSWRWPKSGLAMAWLAGPLPPALTYPEQSHGRLTLKFCCIHVHVYLKIAA